MLHSLSFSKTVDLSQDDWIDRKHFKSFYRSDRHLIWYGRIVWSNEVTLIWAGPKTCRPLNFDLFELAMEISKGWDTGTGWGFLMFIISKRFHVKCLRPAGLVQKAPN
jgi:hypothetical protein